MLSSTSCSTGNFCVAGHKFFEVTVYPGRLMATMLKFTSAFVSSPCITLSLRARLWQKPHEEVSRMTRVALPFASAAGE